MTHQHAINSAHDERRPFSYIVRALDFVSITPYYFDRLLVRGN